MCCCCPQVQLSSHAASSPAPSLGPHDHVRPDVSFLRRRVASPPSRTPAGPEESSAVRRRQPRRQEEEQNPGGRVENQEQDGADVRGRGRGGDDRAVVRRRAALQALLPGEENKHP